MDLEEYRIMHDAEDTHWWYRGLRGVMCTLLRLNGPGQRQPRILDAGCGTGGNLCKLEQAGYTDAFGFDYSPLALDFCRERGLKNVCRGSLMSIPFPSDTFDIVISCDVVNDAGLPDEMQALRELYRVLKPGGRLFLNLPAYSFLWGEHDRATNVVRRYTTAGITKKLRGVGFKVGRATYWNMFLFPVVLTVRLLSRLKGRTAGTSPRSDISIPPPPFNTLLTMLMALERRLLKRGRLPFGSSVAVLAAKPRCTAVRGRR